MLNESITMVEAGSSFHQEQGNSTLLGKITQNAFMAMGANFFEWFSMGSEHYACSLETLAFLQERTERLKLKKVNSEPKSVQRHFSIVQSKNGKGGPFCCGDTVFFLKSIK